MSGRCEFYADAIVQRAVGALDGEGALRLEAHLAECSDCAAALATVQALRAAPVEPPAGLETRIRAAVRDAGVSMARPGVTPASEPGADRERTGRARWWPWALPLAAAAALAALWLGVGVPDSPDDGLNGALAAFEDYDPYGAWPADGLFVAGEPVLSELSVEELERLLAEMET